MIAPELWLNGRPITGTAASRAPVLAPARLVWGAASALEQPKPATLTFTVLFRDGMHDIPDLANGAAVELLHAGVAVFAGIIRTMDAEPSKRRPGALEVTCTATDHTTSLDHEFTATDWPAGTARPTHLTSGFLAAGWQLELFDDGRPSAAARYKSIKLVTLLDRYLSRYRGRRYDTSYRAADGQLVRRLTVARATERSAPADRLVAGPGRVWGRTLHAPLHDGAPSPLLVLPAYNVLNNPSWSMPAENAVTAVELSTMAPGADGYTELAESTYQAAAELRARYGTTSIGVETDLSEPADWEPTAAAWMNDDSPWNMSALLVRDSRHLAPDQLAALLDPARRNRTLVAVTGVLANRPDPGPSVLRSYLLAGEYEWTGTAWQLQLGLERTIYATRSHGIRYEDIRRSLDRNIYAATFDSIGPALTFADFREIEATSPAGNWPADQRWTWAALKESGQLAGVSFTTVNPSLTYSDFTTTRKA